MKALVLVEYNRFEYKDVAKPEAGSGEVLIAVEAWTAGQRLCEREGH